MDDQVVDMFSGGIVRIGGHSGRFEPPDVCVGVFAGDVSEDDMRGMCAMQNALADRVRRLLVLVDASRVTGMSQGARRCMAEELIDTNVVATAMFGASFHIRVLATLVVKGREILKLSEAFPFRVFETEPEARAWLALQRQGPRARSMGSGGSSKSR